MSEQLKVLMLAGQFYPDLAGSGIATHGIAAELSDRGHDVTVCVDSTSRYLDEVESNPPFKLEFIPDYKKFMLGESGFRLPTEALHEVLSSTDYDVVHTYSYMPMLLLSMMQRPSGASSFFTFWNAPHRGERALGFYKSPVLDLQLARHIISLGAYDEMILGSRCSYESALDLGADPTRTSFTYHGINIASFKQGLQMSDSKLSDYFDGVPKDSGEPLITLPGRITKRKGVFEAVGALAIVRQSHDAYLLLTSSGELEDQPAIDAVMQLADSLGVAENVIPSKTMLPHEHMPMLYRESDVVITPSYYEGLGFTAIEALAAARPLIITDVPGLNEVGIPGVNCLSVPPKDQKSLAASINRLLEDKELAQGLTSEAPRSVQKFDMKFFADYLIAQYVRRVG